MAAGVALAIGLGVASWRLSGPQPTTSSVSGTASIGGPFQLVDQAGRPQTEALLKGRWSAVFFGYTYCPDVCPATLTTLGAAKSLLGEKGQALQTVLVSIDPERDTPAQLKAYLEAPAFPPGTVGLTGTPAQIAAMAKAYKVYYAKQGSGTDYLMDHASAIYLIDPAGRFDRLVDPSGGPKAVADALQKAMQPG